MRSFVTVAGQCAATFTVNKSEFISAAYPIAGSAEAAEILKSVRKKYFDATHTCYAFIAGESGNERKFSDDGEPQGTAGLPILEVLAKRGLTDVLVTVTRYFGGIKLGAGGLVRAYSSAAAQVLDACETIRKIEADVFEVTFDYPLFYKVEKPFLKLSLEELNRRYDGEVTLKVATYEEEFERKIAELSGGKAVCRGVGRMFCHFKNNSVKE